jgi:hypothetical protein
MELEMHRNIRNGTETQPSLDSVPKATNTLLSSPKTHKESAMSRERKPPRESQESIGRRALRMRVLEQLTEDQLCARLDMSPSNLYRGIAAARAAEGKLSPYALNNEAIDALLRAGWGIPQIVDFKKSFTLSRVMLCRDRLEETSSWRYETDPLLK